ncbi:hypothetical protein LTR56_017505 [Elasticomyces elasticus]|nr:hypothetical protein LTR56_017505 [Elasticomyces elasticus]KAK3665094.1 hypothetical protein LTR22_004150 [Elasticomyces elasticus]KAK4931530.1 hypothetical protein LTR49_001918 [Elasticomyces elasticus]KAK5766689.1 hypothetical protein LTS12_003038 [Elasticomyces elasticus]
METKAIFQKFLTWLYADELVLTVHSSAAQYDAFLRPKDLQTSRIVRGHTGVQGYATSNPMYSLDDLHCVQLYDFGITYDIPGFSNSALAALAARNENLYCTTALSAVQLAFELRPRAPQLRRYLVAEATRRLESKNVRASLVDFPKAFVHKILRRTLRGNKPKNLKWRTSREGWARTMQDFYIPESNPPDAQRLEAFQRFDDPDPERVLSYSGVEPIVHLLVGPRLVRFSVHEQLISRYSVYFRKALLGAFAEGQSKVVTLDQESVSDVSLFLDWLYTSRAASQDVMHLEESSEDEDGQHEIPQSVDAVPVAATVLDTEGNNSDDDSDIEDEGEADDAVSHTSATPSVLPDEIADECYDDVRPYAGLAFDSILDPYIFADRRGVQKLQNDIMNRLAAWREAGFPLMSASVSRVQRVYDLLPPNSPMRAYLVEEAGLCWDQDVISADRLSEYPSDFVAGAMQTMLECGRLRDQIRPPSWRYNLCWLHEHRGESKEIEEEECWLSLMNWHNEMKTKEDMEPVRP